MLLPREQPSFRRLNLGSRKVTFARFVVAMRARLLAVGAVLAGAALLVRSPHSPGRTVLWENFDQGDYIDRQVRQARADGIR
jgi:hypothetical protein